VDALKKLYSYILGITNRYVSLCDIVNMVVIRFNKSINKTIAILNILQIIKVKNIDTKQSNTRNNQNPKSKIQDYHIK